MKKLETLNLLTLIFLAQAKEIKITKIENSPGILPFKIGTNRIVINKHIFIHNIDLTTLKNEIDQLITSYNNLNILILEEKSLYSRHLSNSYEHLGFLISEIKYKFGNIDINRKIKQKRGLINIGGSVQKFIFGTLDSNDGERYDKAIRLLKDNQQNILTNVNGQISIAKQLMHKYTETIEKITKNQKKISKYFEEYSLGLENLTNLLYKYTVYSSMLEQIFISANFIITFLDNLENAITFASLHVTHPDILTQNDLEHIINNLKSYYNQNDILNLNSWYSIITTYCYFIENKIIFAMEFPIVYPKIFNYFHLFPIPTTNNTIIIPMKPYLALNEEAYQYMDQPCMKLEQMSLCRREELKFIKFDEENDCLSSLVHDRKTICHQVPIEEPSKIFNEVNDEYLIIISKLKIKVMLRCPEEQFSIIQGINLLHIPINCSISYQSYYFGNTKQTDEGIPLILPKIINDSTILKIIPRKPIKIDKVPLEDIHQLQKHIDATNQLLIPEVPEYSTHWTTWVIIAICAVGVVYSFTRLSKSKVSFSTTQRVNVVDESPSILFQPEADI